MAFEDHKGFIDPGVKAASAILPFQPVGLDTVADQVVPLTVNTSKPYGLNGPASVARTEALTSYGRNNIVKAVAGASLGHGAEVGIASTNGALGPVTGASGVTKWSIGEARSAAAAGERFSVYVNPRQLSNLI